MAGHGEGKLSRQQKAILLHLYRLWQEYEEWTPEWGHRDEYGVPWHTKGAQNHRPSVSRALKRLEARGLLRRQNYMDICYQKPAPFPHLMTPRHRTRWRTTCIALLPEGIALAKRLTSETT
jgi:hypothetical protein